MENKYSIIDMESRGPYITFLLFCTAGLVISTPSPRPVESSLHGNLFLKLPLFFFIYLLFSAIFGLNSGSISQERKETGRTFLLVTGGRILLVNVMCIPLFIFQRALYPGQAIYFPLIVLYGVFLGFLFSGLSKALESPDALGLPQGFLLKYFLLVCFFFLPQGLLSAMIDVQTLLYGGAPSVLSVEILVAAGLTLLVWLILITRTVVTADV